MYTYIQNVHPYVQNIFIKYIQNVLSSLCNYQITTKQNKTNYLGIILTLYW
jgi:hypothetical protein